MRKSSQLRRERPHQLVPHQVQRRDAPSVIHHNAIPSAQRTVGKPVRVVPPAIAVCRFVQGHEGGPVQFGATAVDHRSRRSGGFWGRRGGGRRRRSDRSGGHRRRWCGWGCSCSCGRGSWSRSHWRGGGSCSGWRRARCWRSRRCLGGRLCRDRRAARRFGRCRRRGRGRRGRTRRSRRRCLLGD